MFLGEYEHSVDEKGRIAIPAKFRAGLGDGLVVTRGFDENLLIYPMDVWRELTTRINALSQLDPASRSLRRMLFGGAADFELDKQGRLLLPANLRAYAKIGSEAVVAGMDTFIEVWAKDSWQAILDSFPAQGAAIAQQVAALGI